MSVNVYNQFVQIRVLLTIFTFWYSGSTNLAFIRITVNQTHSYQNFIGFAFLVGVKTIVEQTHFAQGFVGVFHRAQDEIPRAGKML